MKHKQKRARIRMCLNCAHSDHRAFSKKLLLLVFVLSCAFCSISVMGSSHAENVPFRVNVSESLSVSITAPTTPANGNVDTFLRNKYTLSITSNNTNGFTASMYAVGNTNLTNTALNDQSIPTLENSSTRRNFPANFWGYSLGTEELGGINYNETDSGNSNSHYYPLVSTSASPITVLSQNNGGSGSQDIYFGAKADTSKAAGNYSSIVVISVVSGVIDTTNPITPNNPVGPNPESDNEVAKYSPAPSGDSGSGVTTYTYRRSNASAGTITTTTQVSDGDNRDSYSGYTPPQGVSERTISNINNDPSLAIGLATTATVAASAGVFFFILAKRREDDEENED